MIKEDHIEFIDGKNPYDIYDIWKSMEAHYLSMCINIYSIPSVDKVALEPKKVNE